MNIRSITIQSMLVYLATSLLSTLLLLCLMLFDPYFKNLSFPAAEYQSKIVTYQIMTFFIPILTMIVVGIRNFFKRQSNKIMTAIAVFIGIIVFAFIDSIIKRKLIIYSDAFLSAVLWLLLYSLTIAVLFKIYRKTS